MEHTPEDVEGLRQALADARAEAAAARALASSTEAVIAALKLEILKLRRELYGQRSERRGRPLAPMEVAVEEVLFVPFEFRAIDIAVVVIPQQNLPQLERFAVAVTPARPAVDDLGALLAFAVGVGASIERVLEHGDRIAVADRCPLEGDQLLAVGGPREVDLLGEHREQDLPGTAELAEAGENQPDHLLDPQVGIEAETELAMPHIADRHADAQLTAPRFGAGGVEHAGTQHTELELADAALHAEQQPVVRPAGVIDPVQIDHPRLHQPAELEQVMPVATVAGEPGRIEAQHGSDLARTRPGDQPLEAGPGHRPAGGATEVVVDHLDLAEAPTTRDLDELILSPLALEVGLDLRLGGLPDTGAAT